MDANERKHAEAIVEKAINQLREHFDTVQIFCTRDYGQSTESFERGSGNFYARLGLAKVWVDCEVAADVNSRLKEKDEE